METLNQPPMVVHAGGVSYELVPSLAALRGINATLGGLLPAFEKVKSLNFDAMASVIVAASGEKVDQAGFDRLVTAIWQGDDGAKTGAVIVDYLLVMLNGGRSAVDDAPASTKPGKP